MHRNASRLMFCAIVPALLLPVAAGCRLTHSRSAYYPTEVESAAGEAECETCQEEGSGAVDPVDVRIAEEAARPIGARQKMHAGKLWPPYPRPTGKQQTIAHRYHHAHYWPHPYVCQDREYVRTVSHLQTVNGWMEETTLYGYHFDEETVEVTHSGLLQMRWILENAPVEYRVVFVQTGPSVEISQARMNSVRRELVAMVGESNLPPIMLRVCSSLGRPALEVDTIRRSELQSMPEPRITYESLPTGSSGGQ